VVFTLLHCSPVAAGVQSWMEKPFGDLDSIVNRFLCNKIGIKSSWYVNIASFAFIERASAGSFYFCGGKWGG